MITASACGPVTPGKAGNYAGAVPAACTTVLQGVIREGGSLTSSWLPAGFGHSASAGPGAAPSATYRKATGRPDPPRVDLTYSIHPGPLTRTDTGDRQVVTAVRVQGHPGLVGSGQPGPQFIGVYWKQGSRYLVQAVGYQVRKAQVLRVAQHVTFVPPGLVRLPVAAGSIVSRKDAIATAAGSAGGSWTHAAAKLSSWTEITAMLSARTGRAPAAPAALTSAPYRPAWAVLLSGGAAAAPVLVVVDAATGRTDLRTAAGGRAAEWFAALTDRDLSGARRCPGGSDAWVPFGVLTRNEEAYLAGQRPVAGTGQASVTTRLVLSTVAVVNKADRGMYGGCVQQDCSIGQMVWVRIDTVRAAPGHTLACLPPSASYPAGYRPKHVKQYVMVSVPGNYGIYCGSPPRPLLALKDLAPPTGAS